MWDESDTFEAYYKAENCIAADEIKSRPAVAKPNWFDRLCCFFGIHDVTYDQESMILSCKNCPNKTENLREWKLP